MIPVTVDDLAANGLLEEDHPPTCWQRSVETLTARKEEIAGLAVASGERIEAYLIYMQAPGRRRSSALHSFVDDGGTRLTQLLSQFRGGGMGTVRFPKVHPAEISKELLGTLSFRSGAAHRLYAARARSA